MSDARTVLREFNYLDCGWYPHEKASDKCARCDGFADAILAALADAGLVTISQHELSALRAVAEGAKEWCHQVKEVGTGWDDWDYAYKTMSRKLLPALEGSE
jgi:hypothetical protein